MRKIVQSLTFAIALLAFGGSAFAGPIGDTLQEAGKLVGAAEDALTDRAGEVISGTKETVEQVVSEVARNVQGHIDAALESRSNGDQEGARKHALAARYEMRKVSDLLGLKLPALTKKQIADKAGNTPRFKAALAKLPSGKVLIMGACKLPNYGRCAKKK